MGITVNQVVEIIECDYCGRSVKPVPGTTEREALWDAVSTGWTVSGDYVEGQSTYARVVCNELACMYQFANTIQEKASHCPYEHLQVRHVEGE